MSNAVKKDRGLDKPAQTSKGSGIDADRLVNRGITVNLSDGRTVRVKDIPFDAWLTGLADLIPIIVTLSETQIESIELMVSLAKNPTVRTSLYYLMSQATADLTPDEVAQLNAADALKMLVALKKVIDFKEIKELFSQAGLNLGVRTTANVDSQTPQAS